MFRISCLLICLLLTACSGDSTSGSGDSSTPPAGQPPLTSNTSGDVTTGNLQLSVNVSDSEGLAQVELRIAQSDAIYLVCGETHSCPNTTLSTEVDDFSPGFYQLEAGELTIELWVTNNAGQQNRVDVLNVNWEPIVIDNVLMQRSADGLSMTVSWQPSPRLLRYNLYIAAEPGVNRYTVNTLQEGQMILAIDSGDYQIDNLDPLQTYFVSLTGVDGSGESAYAPEQSILGGVNSSPIAENDDETIDEDSSAVFSPLTNDTDPDGDDLTISDVTADRGETSIIDQTMIRYVPPADFFGQATITYTISDRYSAMDTAIIQVEILAVNDTPVANPDIAVTTPNVPVNIDVLANDTDADGDILSVVSASATNGSVQIETDNTITYQPDPVFTGTDIVTYSIDDAAGAQAQSTAEVTVTSAGLPPQASDDYYEMVEGTVLTIDASSGLLNNDSDPNNQPLTVNATPVVAPTNGTVVLSSDGGFTYTPNAGFDGTDDFRYEISTPQGDTDEAVVSLNVLPLPDNLTGESSSISGDFLYIGLGETQAGNNIGSGRYRIGHCIQLIDTQCSMTGQYQELAGSGNQPGETGRYAFMMRYPGTGVSPVIARSNTADSNSLVFTDVGDATFNLTLFPSGGGQTRALFPDQAFATLSNFGAFIASNASCQGLPAGTPCSIGSVGKVVDAVIQAPLDRLTFSLNGYASVDISSEPIAEADSYTLAGDQSFSVAAPGVLANDSDNDSPVVGQTLEVRNNINGTVGEPIALATDEYQQWIFIYPAFGTDIQIIDRSGVQLNNIPWPGEGANDADMDVITQATSLANIDLQAGTLLSFNGETGPTEVYAIDSTNGNVLAQLNTSFGDSHVVGGAYNPVTESLFLLQDNVPTPGVRNRIAQVDITTGDVIDSFDINAQTSLFNVSYGDLDINNETGNLYLVSSAEGRMLELTPSGEFVRYLPLPAAVSSPSGLAINDRGDRVWAINNTTAAPVQELAFSNLGRLPTLVARILIAPSHGSVTLSLNGSFTYTPQTGFTGEDEFTYEVLDQTGKSAQARVTLTVSP